MRYLPLTAADRREMLAVIGAPDIDALFVDVPGRRLLRELPDLPRTPGRAGGRARAVRRWRRGTWPRARGRSSAAPAPTSIMCRRPSIT